MVSQLVESIGRRIKFPGQRPLARARIVGTVVRASASCDGGVRGGRSRKWFGLGPRVEQLVDDIARKPRRA